VFAPWANLARIHHTVGRYRGARLVRHHIEFRNGVTMTFGGDLWSDRDCARIAEFVTRRLAGDPRP